MPMPTHFWDILAKRYPRFNTDSMRQDVETILAWTKEQGVAYAPQSTLLDIGSGTGTFSIPLALLHVNVTAIDTSAKMLAILKEDAQNEGIEGFITTYQSDWDSFVLTRTYDIVLASMTPAIHDSATIDKMINASTKYGIFVSWGAYRINAFVDALLLSHRPHEHFSQTGSIKAEDVIAQLEKKNISYTHKRFETQWSDTYSLDDAKAYAKEQLERRGIEADEEKIERLITDFSHNASVNISTKAEKIIVVWKH